MTKAGANSLIADIRVYVGPQIAHLKNNRSVVEFAERVVLALRPAAYSFGAATHLYVLLQKTETGIATIGFRPGAEHWMLYVDASVPANFEDLEVDLRNQIIFGAIRASLLKLTPDHTDQINGACDAAVDAGSQIRFLVKSRTFRKAKIVVSVNVPDYPSKAVMWVEATEPASGRLLQRHEIVLRDHQHAFKIASAIKIVGNQITLVPRSSFSAGIELRKYDLPITFAATWL